VAETLRQRGQRIDWCITGEPSSTATLGDLLRVGRRGSLSATLTVHGVQGHVAYPHKARNPIHQAMPALAELAARVWDAGYEDFPPTSLQISNIHAGTGARSEPSSAAPLGALPRVGRGGSLLVTLTVHGSSGPVAYPPMARNPIHQAMPALAELAARVWDAGYVDFPPTSLQISNSHAGTGA